MESELEVIDAFIDGERVDANALKSALETAEGRSYLVDAWLLRGAIQDDAQPGDDGQAPRARAVELSAPSRSPRSAGRWLVGASIAASLAGGFALGRMMAGSPGTNRSTPAPTATVSVEPAPAFPVPAPTRVIQLEFHSAPSKTGGD